MNSLFRFMSMGLGLFKTLKVLESLHQCSEVNLLLCF